MKPRSTALNGRTMLACLALLGVHTLTAQQPPKAVPVDANGNPVPRAVPATGVTPAGQSPDEDLFAYATLCYSQGDFAIAIKPFQDYTRLYSRGAHIAEAWFKLGECFLKTNQNTEARRAYNEVVTRFPKSESAASASYRLGAFAYNAKEFARAATYFETCEKATTDATVRLASAYNKGLAFSQAGQKKSALAAYKSVAAAKGENPYRETALGEIASIALSLGQKDDALAAFNDIISGSKDEAIVGDALVKSGLILNDTGKSDAALKNFKRALEIRTLPKETRGIAVFGMIQGAYAKGDYQAVVDTYVANATSLPSPDLRPKLLLLVGNAHRFKKNYRQAIEVYLILEKQFAESAEAFEGSYHKLVCFSQLGDTDLPKFAEAFEEKFAAGHKDHEYIIMSRVIRADSYFRKGEYAKAAEAFAGVDPKRVPEKIRGSVLYQKGFAEAESGKANEAVATLTEFITDYPEDANVPVAIAERGISHKNVRAFDKALADFSSLIKDHAKHPAVEMACYQSGLIKMETRDTQGMIADFEMLVSKFPQTAAAADAWYQIGRGYFDLAKASAPATPSKTGADAATLKFRDNLAKALEPLRKAASTDKEKYGEKSSQLLIACQFLREDVDGLATEVDAYRGTKKDANISPSVLEFLGVKFYERKNYRASVRYLRLLATPKEPAQTKDTVWNVLGLASLEEGEFDEAVAALDNYLTVTAEAAVTAARPKALWSKGRALLGLKKFDEADKAVDDGGKLVKEGKIHAQLEILKGDISAARGDSLAAAGDKTGAANEWKKAAGNYVVISQLYGDGDITPEALDKAVTTLEKLGEKEKAESLRKQLTGKYPDYKSPKSGTASN